MILYRCHISDEQTRDTFDLHAESGKGEECRSENMPPEWNQCLTEITFGWVGFEIKKELIV